MNRKHKPKVKIMSKSQAEQPSTGVALFSTQLPSAPPSYLQTEAPRGNTSVSSEDMAMPKLKLLQSLSPEIDAAKGIHPGLFLNNISNNVYETVLAVNLHFQKEFVIFKKRTLGGGFMGSAQSESEAQALVRSLPGTPADYDLSESHRHVLLLLDRATGAPLETVAMFMATPSSLYSSRSWNTELSTLSAGKYDRFSMIWELTADKVTNNKGSFHVLKSNFMGWAPETLHAACKGLYSAIDAASGVKPAPIDEDSVVA
jgi:hypothetical protein